jgi:hypothetical protein
MMEAVSTFETSVSFYGSTRAMSQKTAIYLYLSASIIALMMEASRSSETLVNFYQTTQRYNPEDSHLLVLVGHEIFTTSKNVSNKMTVFWDIARVDP